jgi:long-subunit fatty acid transport protein
MKKLFLIAATLLLTTGIFAQSGISFGLRAIPTFNWVTPSDEDSMYTFENDATKMGIGFGPSVRYKFSDNFNMDLSAIFTWQKFGIVQTNQMPDNAVATDITENFKVQYLQIPFNFNGQFDVATDFQALINFGVGTGIKLASSRMMVDNIHHGIFVEEYEKVGVLNFIDFYLTAGAGVVYNLEDNLHLSLTVQYNNGIIDGWLDGQNEDPSTITDLSIKHKNVALSLGFYIDL